MMINKKNVTIIGNGFDMNLEIKSSYNNFIHYIEKSENLTTTEDKYKYNQLFVQNFNGKELNWCDFESIFEKQIIEINESEDSKELGYTKEFLISRVNQDIKKLENQFHEYLTEKFETRHAEIVKAIRKNNSEEDPKQKINSFYRRLFEFSDTIINFNYTPTISRLFPNAKDKLFHIHGTLENNNIIFGGGFSGTNLIKEKAVKGSTENDKLIRSKKDAKISEERAKISEKISGTDVIIDKLSILGHSVIGSDFVFLKSLIEKSDKVYLFYHKQDYEEKFQFLVNNLSKENIEKIHLAPMFDVLVPEKEENNIIFRAETTGNYEFVKDIFNFPIPRFQEENDFFESFEIPKYSNLLEQIGNITIDRQVVLAEVLKVFNSLPESFAYIFDDKNIQISIGTNDDNADSLERNDLSALFHLKLFKEMFKKAIIFELRNCRVDLDDLRDLLTQNQLTKIVIENNIIYYGQGETKTFELGLLNNLFNINISDNEFNGVNDYGNKGPMLEVSLDGKINARVVSIVENVNLSISSDILQGFSNVAQIALSVHAGDIEIKLDNVEKLTLIQDNSESEAKEIPNIKLNQEKLENIIFKGFTIDKIMDKEDNEKGGKWYHPFSISSLFSSFGNKALLKKLLSIEFEDCDVADNAILVDCHVNLFDNQEHTIIVNRESYKFLDIEEKPGGNYGKFITREESIFVVNEDNKPNTNSVLMMESDASPKSPDKVVTNLQMSESLLKFKQIFMNIPEATNFSLNESIDLSYFIEKTADFMKLSENQLRTSFDSYRKNKENGVPYISDIVDSLKLLGEEFVAYYEKIIHSDDEKENITYRGRARIIEKLWKRVLDEVLVPISR